MVGLTPPRLLRPVLEALVGRLRAHDCEPCFLLLGRRDRSAAERDAVLAGYRDVAAAHQVRCVDLVEELGRDEGMFRDVVHSSSRGAEEIAARVAAAVDPVDAEPGPTRRERWAPSFADARLVPASAAQLRDPVAGETGVLGGLFPYALARPGNPFEMSLEGELIGIVVAIGPTAGGVRVAGDGPPERAVLWDDMCHYERLSTLVLAEPRPLGTAVTVEAVDEQIDYASAHQPVADPAAIAQDLRLIGYMVRE